MEDLTKITTPFGLLDEETQEALMAHEGPYEIYSGPEWSDCLYPVWSFSKVYRVKPQPMSKPNVPWEIMADWVRFVARDEDRSFWAFDCRPEIATVVWEPTGKIADLSAIKIDPGTCDWRDSLVERP